MTIESVWVFVGDKGRFPSAVFSSREKAEAWIAAQALSGTLTRYPVDQSAYEWAIAQGFFTPRQDRHQTARFIQNFSSAYQEHYHYQDMTFLRLSVFLGPSSDRREKQCPQGRTGSSLIPASASCRRARGLRCAFRTRDGEGLPVDRRLAGCRVQRIGDDPPALFAAGLPDGIVPHLFEGLQDVPARRCFPLCLFTEADTLGLAVFATAGAEDAHHTVLTAFRHGCSPVLVSLWVDLFLHSSEVRRVDSVFEGRQALLAGGHGPVDVGPLAVPGHLQQQHRAHHGIPRLERREGVA